MCLLKRGIGRTPPHQYEEVRKHLDEMLRMGAIRRSNSPWASAVVLICKKDGALRFCIDLRKLNERTVKDTYSLPRIEDSLDVLNGSCIFTSIDLKSGYWQVELDEKKYSTYCIHSRTPGLLQMCADAFWPYQRPCHFSKVDGIMFK